MTSSSFLKQVVKLEIAKISVIDSFLYYNYTNECEVVFKSGYTWENIPIIHGASSFIQKKILNEKAGVYFDVSFSGEILGIQYPDRTLNEITNEPVLCRLTEENGSVFIAGTNDSPVRIEYEYNSSANICVLNFTKKSKNSVFVEKKD